MPQSRKGTGKTNRQKITQESEGRAPSSQGGTKKAAGNGRKARSK